MEAAGSDGLAPWPPRRAPLAPAHRHRVVGRAASPRPPSPGASIQARRHARMVPIGPSFRHPASQDRATRTRRWPSHVATSRNGRPGSRPKRPKTRWGGDSRYRISGRPARARCGSLPTGADGTRAEAGGQKARGCPSSRRVGGARCLPDGASVAATGHEIGRRRLSGRAGEDEEPRRDGARWRGRGRERIEPVLPRGFSVRRGAGHAETVPWKAGGGAAAAGGPGMGRWA